MKKILSKKEIIQQTIKVKNERLGYFATSTKFALEQLA